MQHANWISWILKIVQIWHSRSPEELPTRSHVLQRHLLLVGLMMLTVGYSTGYSSVAQAEAWVGGADGLPTTASNPAHPADSDRGSGDGGNVHEGNVNEGNIDRLAIPSSAIEVPIGAADPGATEQSWENLPPPDQSTAISPVVSKASPEAAPVAATLLQTIKTATALKPVELAFALSPQTSFQPQTATPEAVPETALGANTESLANLFVGNSDSLVAKAVGSAEGTRTPEGDRNPAYFGHVDPGNKAWNLGSFSYQHEAATPEDADAKQLNRLQDQAGIMQAKAQAKGMSLTLKEALNGIDLANQAPKAVLDQDGYVDWLAKAHQNGLLGDDAVLWARTQSFFDPNLQRWNAPGLGNTQERINHDQERRMQAIDRAIAIYGQPAGQTVAQPAQPAQPAQAEQPALQVAQPSLQANAQTHSSKISEDIGIARLFAEQTVTHFGGYVPPSERESSQSQPSQSASRQSGTATESTPELTAPEPEKRAIALPKSAPTLPESPGIAALFSLDLPTS